MPTKKHTQDNDQDASGAKDAPTKDAPTKDAPTKDAPAKDAPAPAKAAAPTEPAANAAAPLQAPTPRDAGSFMPQHAVVSSMLDERHLGVVDENGRPVDLNEVLVRGSGVGTLRFATQRIYEQVTIPGSEAPRLRLLFGVNAPVPEPVFEQLAAAQRARADQSA